MVKKDGITIVVRILGIKMKKLFCLLFFICAIGKAQFLPTSPTFTAGYGYLNLADYNTFNGKASSAATFTINAQACTLGVSSTVTVTVANGGTGVIAIPKFRAYRNADITSFTPSSYTKIQYDTETYDTNNNYDPSTNYRFTPTIAGYYDVRGIVSVLSSAASSTNTQILLAIYKNGVSVTREGQYGPITSGNPVSITVKDLISMNGSTDYLEIFLNQTPAVGTTTVNGGTINTYFEATLIP